MMGMYRCISPYTSMEWTTLLRYALSPQLKSWRGIREIFRAAQLNNFEGRFLVHLLSYRTFFQPDTTSYPCWVIIWYSSGISSGLSCRSASMVITTSPRDILNPVLSAADLP